MTVFEVSHSQLLLRFLGSCLVFTFPIVILFVFQKWNLISKTPPFFIFIFGAVFFTIGQLIQYSDYANCISEVSENNDWCGSIEGKVEIIKADIKRDEIKISNKKFVISSDSNQPVYKVPIKFGGLLTDGKLVKVRYVYDRIIKIEVLE